MFGLEMQNTNEFMCIFGILDLGRSEQPSAQGWITTLEYPKYLKPQRIHLYVVFQDPNTYKYK